MDFPKGITEMVKKLLKFSSMEEELCSEYTTRKMDLKIFAGVSAEGQIFSINEENVLKIPLTAIISKDGKTYVLVKKGNDENGSPISEEKEIELGTITESFAEVVKGLNEGEIILIKSITKNLSSIKKSPAKIPTGRVLGK